MNGTSGSDATGELVECPTCGQPVDRLRLQYAQELAWAALQEQSREDRRAVARSKEACLAVLRRAVAEGELEVDLDLDRAFGA